MKTSMLVIHKMHIIFYVSIIFLILCQYFEFYIEPDLAHSTYKYFHIQYKYNTHLAAVTGRLYLIECVANKNIISTHPCPMLRQLYTFTQTLEVGNACCCS